MSQIIEVDDAGMLQLPAHMLGGAKPRTRYVLLQHGTTLVLQPLAATPLWMHATPAERASAIRAWAARERPSAPVLPDTVLHRDQMYD
jgi:hypothetical protein